MPSKKCRICNNSEANQVHRAREMMFGTRDEFDYLECGRCGTLQIVDVPDLSRYYPKDYYSLDCAETYGLKERSSRFMTRLFFKHRRSRFSSFASPLASVIRKFRDKLDLDARILDRGLGLTSVLRLDIPLGSRILDVGCGDGKLLNVLSDLCFTSLTGADAFVQRDMSFPNGVTIRKREIAEVDEEFDLVMFHHSFEHLPEPLEALRNARNLLSGNGTCLVRIPLVNYAWEKYGVNWVGLDPPRHLFLFTEKSFRHLASEAGFIVETVVYDSTSFQFSASEQYLRNVPLIENGKELFSAKQFSEWRTEARRLNEAGKGDQATFYLRPA